MSIEFADSMNADTQDRVCSILASLSLMVDTHKRMRNFNGNMQWVYRHEMEHHYKWAIFNTLRLLGILTHSSIGNSANVDRICDMGHAAFEEIIYECADGFDTKDEDG